MGIGGVPCMVRARSYPSGVAGAFVGRFVFELFTGRPQVIRFDLGSLVVAVVGAVVVLLIYRLIAGRRT